MATFWKSQQNNGVYRLEFETEDKGKHKLVEIAAHLAIVGERNAKFIPISEIYRCIAGHSNYSGDSILSALECLSEGKEVNPIKPITIESGDLKHGHNLSKTLDEFECSECGFQCCQAYVYGMGDVWYENTNFDYCPGCGAKMDGKEHLNRKEN